MKKNLVYVLVLVLIFVGTLVWSRNDCHPVFGTVNSKEGCVATVLTNVAARYGKGDGIQSLKAGDKIIVYIETDNDYISFLSIDGMSTPAWISKESLIIN